MRALSYYTSRLIARLLLAPFLRVHLLRPELAERPGPFILAANHISHFDPPIILTQLRRKIDCMGMADLFAHPLFARWLRSVDAFPVVRGEYARPAIRTALARLRARHAIAIFVEGGIRDGTRSVLQGAPARLGAAALSQLTGAPIIPCAIIGSDRCYQPRAWRPWHPIPIWIAFAPPLLPPAGLTGQAARATLTAELQAAFIRLNHEMQAHFHLRPDDLPQPPARRIAQSVP